MRQDYEITALYLQGLNCTSLEFGGKKLLQRKVFLAMCFGLPVWYSFSWGIFGPFSSSLQEDAYRIILLSSPINKELNTKSIEIINVINSFSKGKPDNFNNDQWYDLISSIAYWDCIGVDNVVDKVRTLKPYFLEEEIESAYEFYKVERYIHLYLGE